MRGLRKTWRPFAGALMVLGAAGLLSACTMGGGAVKAPVQPPYGGLITQYKAPLDLHMADDSPVTEVSESDVVGTSEASYVFIPLIVPGLSFAWDDASIEKAAANGGITNPKYADYEVFNVLGIYVNTKVHVYGK